ncbi:ATP-binding cassette domain-containing protein [Candidatus Venteria ishoeyi]|uniref:Probable ATP-binding protein YheS n=1 Tax=Candidatus Venteria ishoeyi TaxID=1899563 RepID=A0A1H6FGR8_9GAMM|nr:ATP-binding cassette domain-containing protein [Candidatus Venteria ishoeyi]SEH08621.1 putative ABC transporter ATP-binding protein YheS [Candidatus Venteria ishoeyi]
MIAFQELSLQRGYKPLLQDVNLRIYPGWKVGITGANGSGKSSVFSLLLGELQADSGNLQLPSNWVIAHVAQETPALERSALDYVLDGDVELRDLEKQLAQATQTDDGMKSAQLHEQLAHIDAYSAHARAGRLLHGLGFSEAQHQHAVKQFSGGWRMRLNLARALKCRSDLLLLDEPTNHLDLDALLWFEQWLKNYRGTLLLISHDRDFLDNTVDQIAWLHQLNIHLYAGNYSAFERQRGEQLLQQQAAFDKQQRQKAHLQQFIDRFRAKATKAKQAQSRIKALEKMETIQAAHIDSPFGFQFKPPETCPNPLFTLEQADAGYGDEPILKNLNLRMPPGARIGLLGANGAGKSTFIQLLAGDLAPMQGKLEAHSGLKIGYFAQHQLEHLHLQSTPLEHLQRLDKQATEQQLRDFLGGFGFPGDRATEIVAPFSGGEKARLALALLVWQKPNLLLLDEPTNHLDLEMRHALGVALQAYAGALLIISHDRHLLKITTDQLYLVANQKLEIFDGDLDDYRQWLLQESRQQNQANTTANPQAQDKQTRVKQNKQLRAQRKQLENQVKKLEREIEKLTIEKEKLENTLADPALYEDREKAQKYADKREHISVELEALEETWLEIHDQLETLE